MVPIQYKNVKEGLYLIDEYGNIWSNYKKDFLKPNRDKDGYLKIKLSGGNRKSRCYARIATLVAWHFLDRPTNLKDPTINHKDGNILNNHYSNLEWLERSKNSSIRLNKGVGSSNSQAILNETKVEEICELLVTTNLSFTEIAKKFGISKTVISDIHKQKIWKQISSKFSLPCRITVRGEDGRFYSKNILLQ